MTAFYSDTYTFPLPDGHRFPVEKYRLLREFLLKEQILEPEELREANPVTIETLLHAHTEEYVHSFFEGTTDRKIIRRIGLPWSKELVQRSLASVGGTLAAGRCALTEGIAGNLAGGTHHAFRDRGEGYCVFNDIAVAGCTLLQEKAIRRFAVIDLDVHQGNGTAAILQNESSAFTFSMHGKNNFPFHKVASTLDLDLDDNTGDEEYLSLLRHALPHVMSFNPDIIFYQAGVDVLAVDSLGKLALTHEGVKERDRLVISTVLERSIPLVLTLGGGYAKPIRETVRAYAGTWEIAKEVASGEFAG